MLVLTRRRNEKIRVGHDVVFTVLTVGGGQVKIGVTAPEDVTVDREEVYQRKQREKALDLAPRRRIEQEG